MAFVSVESGGASPRPRIVESWRGCHMSMRGENAPDKTSKLPRERGRRAGGVRRPSVGASHFFGLRPGERSQVKRIMALLSFSKYSTRNWCVPLSLIS